MFLTDLNEDLDEDSDSSPTRSEAKLRALPNRTTPHTSPDKRHRARLLTVTPLKRVHQCTRGSPRQREPIRVGHRGAAARAAAAGGGGGWPRSVAEWSPRPWAVSRDRGAYKRLVKDKPTGGWQANGRRVTQGRSTTQRRPSGADPPPHTHPRLLLAVVLTNRRGVRHWPSYSICVRGETRARARLPLLPPPAPTQTLLTRAQANPEAAWVGARAMWRPASVARLLTGNGAYALVLIW